MLILKRFPIRAIWQLLRLEHGLMYGAGVVAGVFIVNRFFNPVYVVYGFLTALFLQSSAFALNDYLDFEIDVLNKRNDRPLVRGELTRRTAITLSLVFLPLGLLFSILISCIAFIFAFLLVIFGYLYNIKLKKLGIIGNSYIAFSMAAPFLYGSIIASNSISIPILILSVIAFISGLGREIMKDIEDVLGDRTRSVRSVPVVKGSSFAAKISVSFYIFAVLLSVVPYLVVNQYAFDLKYGIPVLLADVIFLYTAAEMLKNFSPEMIKRYRKLTLLAMVLGLLGFIWGAF
ncbi:prenyltransferase [Archaeoglobales archaeon ex4484_92]|nr:MAG: prenyltransferase [Archaeoglobales archaeon ex4484_92]